MKQFGAVTLSVSVDHNVCISLRLTAQWATAALGSEQASRWTLVRVTQHYQANKFLPFVPLFGVYCKMVTARACKSS